MRYTLALFGTYINFTDVILPVLNSSVDSPIATASCASNQRHTGSGDFELKDIIEDVSCSIVNFL